MIDSRGLLRSAWMMYYRPARLYEYFLNYIWYPYGVKIKLFGLIYNLLGIYFMVTSNDLGGGLWYGIFWAICFVIIVVVGIDKFLFYRSLTKISEELYKRGVIYGDMDELISEAESIGLNL